VRRGGGEGRRRGGERKGKEVSGTFVPAFRVPSVLLPVLLLMLLRFLVQVREVVLGGLLLRLQLLLLHHLFQASAGANGYICWEMR
jgi:hypothetical protein